MTEAEYIAVRDLSNILAAKELIRGLNAGSNPVIDPDDHKKVCRMLDEWREKSFKQIKTTI